MEIYERLNKRRNRRRRRLINKVFLVINVVILIVNIVLVSKIIDANEDINEDETTTLVADNSNSQTASGDGKSDADINGEEQSTTGEQQNQELPTKPIIIEVGRDDFSWTSGSTDSKKIIDLKYMNQNDYPTGCESVTTWMVLNYMGYDISVDMFIDNYLNTFSISWGENVMFGEDPNVYFIGNPRSSHGYGCYAPVIKEALTEIAGEGSVHELSGMSIDEMIEGYVSRGIPVILWATTNMDQSKTGNSWYVERTDETYTWIAGEHCLLLAGWDAKNYYFYDPYENYGVIAYEKTLVTKRYTELGKQALALVKVNEE